ncbi:TPA: hypothetical protein H3L71_001973 [Escherichia coli]|nr:hypothetical protein [Escherichia coli]HAW3717267.1 hypothetical protein [Escherichia coli]
MSAKVFPAPAGINRKSYFCVQLMHCVPRASGDKPPRKSSEPPTLSVPRASGDKPGALDAMMDIT